jgi:hypothetical protein
MATLTRQVIVRTGTGPTYAAAAVGGDKVPPGSNNFLHVKNGGGAPITVTVDATRPCDQGYDHDLVVSVPAGGDRMIGPLPADRFAGTDSLVAVTYSGVGSVTVAALSTGV